MSEASMAMVTWASDGTLIGSDARRGRMAPTVPGGRRRTNVPGHLWRRILLVRIDVSGYGETIGCRPKSRL